MPVSVLTVFSKPLWPLDSWGELAFNGVGWTLFMAGAAWRWWATLYIGGRKDRALAQCGPYSMTRNPLYFGTFLMTLSVAVLMQSPAFAGMFLIVSAIYLRVTLPNEENRLAAKFGAEYLSYAGRVPRFWPRLDLFSSPATLQVDVGGMRSEMMRAARWLWIPFICHLFSHLRAQEWWPSIHL